MKILHTLLEELAVVEIRGDRGQQVTGISIDSRKVKPGDMFIALEGTATDGHKFIDNAIQNGAKAILCRKIPAVTDPGLTWIVVGDTAEAAGFVAHAFFGHPSRRLRVVGITGTNGKTTVATLLYDLIRSIGHQAGLISTVAYRVGDAEHSSTHTTPDQVTLNALLAEMVAAGCEYAFMEVSSHALAQRRTSGISFAGGVFTNLTHDHLDYHGDFRSYLNTKKTFFDGLGTHAFALTNVDDPRGEVMVQNTQAKVSKYSLHKLAAFRARILDNQIAGLHLQLDGVEIISRLIGVFNAYNLLAVYGAARLLGFEKDDVITPLSGLRPVEGRFDMVYHAPSGIRAVVDYAHTPDALRKVVGTLQQMKTKETNLIVLIGCGGDRDREKRPQMAAIAAEADTAILTSDNPRSEDPEAILDEMEAGVPAKLKRRVLRIANRKEAIRTAVRLASKGDVILIAGKGHEHYQEIHGKRYPFNDKEIVHDALFKDI